MRILKNELELSWGRKMRIKLILVLSVFGGVNIWAHDNKVVHPDVLSAKARNILIPLTNPTASPYYEIYENFYPDVPNTPIHMGTIDEDCIFWNCGEVDGLSMRRHFYNPITGEGLLGFDTAKKYGASVFSTAVSQYLAGNKQNAYYKLGRALHVLQDMSSPPHIAVDIHLPTVATYEDWVTR